MGKGKPRGLNSARKLRVHRRNKYVDYFKIKKKLSTPYCDIVLGEGNVVSSGVINLSVTYPGANQFGEA